MSQDLPPLRQWILPEKRIAPPRKRIYTEADVKLWSSTTQGYTDYGLFYRRLNEAVVGHDLPKDGAVPNSSEAITKTVYLLGQLDSWIDDIPPQESPQRFGNLAFRDWGKRLEERVGELLQALLPASMQGAVPLLSPYLLQSFGSFSRIDYGSGHELAFAMFLCALTLLRFYIPSPEEERALVLVVFEKYVQVVWKLQEVYKLEPAGSHGVWGLDDYSFLTYIWGSAQLRDHPVSRPASVLETPLPETNLYYQSINRIRKLKTGPFHEHSPQLHSVASSVPTWWKVNQGMIKMYEAEVLAKRVVVQHLPLGGIIEWDPDDIEEELDDDVPSSSPAVSPAALGEPVPLEAALSTTPTLPVPITIPASQSVPHGGTSPRVGTSPMPRPTKGRLATLISSTESIASNSPLPPLLGSLTAEPEEDEDLLDWPGKSAPPDPAPPSSAPVLPASGSEQKVDKPVAAVAAVAAVATPPQPIATSQDTSIAKQVAAPPTPTPTPDTRHQDDQSGTITRSTTASADSPKGTSKKKGTPAEDGTRVSRKQTLKAKADRLFGRFFR